MRFIIARRVSGALGREAVQHKFQIRGKRAFPRFVFAADEVQPVGKTKGAVGKLAEMGYGHGIKFHALLLFFPFWSK